MKKSLLAKLLILFSLIGILPLMIFAGYTYHKSRQALLAGAESHMRGDADAIADGIERLFDKARSDILLLTVNPAFRKYFLEPERRSFWLSEVEKALLYLSGIFPDSFDEGCFIRADGREIARTSYGKLALPHELDLDETRNEFFKPAISISGGEVYQGPPYISDDTHRWVVPSATPIVLPDGKKVAIAHMELNVAYLKFIAKELISHGTEQSFVMDDSGNVIFASRLDRKDNLPFLKSGDLEKSESYGTAIEKMKKGERGFEKIVYRGEPYMLAFAPVHFLKNNKNRWSAAVMLPERVIYASITPLRYILLVLFGSGCIIAIAVLLARGILRPVKKLTAISADMAKGNLKQRIAVERSDELGQLAGTFNVMAASLEDAKKELDRRIFELFTLYSISKVLSTTFETEELLKEIVNKVSSSLDIHRVAIMLMDKKTQELYPISFTDFEGTDIRGRRYKPGEGLFGWVAMSGEARLIEDVETSRDVIEKDRWSPDIRSIIAVPFGTHGAVLGVLCAFKDGPSVFRPEDMELLKAVSQHVALALENAKLYEETKIMAVTDGLTGLYNRRFFAKRLDEEIQRAKRYKHHLSLIIIDIDHFKHYNDTHGHQVGDEILKIMAGLITKEIRKSDTAARYGGEEFVVIVSETNKDGAVQLAERIRKSAEEYPFPMKQSQPGGNLTISLGVAAFRDDADTEEGLVKKADGALYKAKEAGRNRVVAA